MGKSGLVSFLLQNCFEQNIDNQLKKIVIVFQRGLVDLDSKKDDIKCLFYAFESIVCQNN